MIPFKGPVGKSIEGSVAGSEPQESYESFGDTQDLRTHGIKEAKEMRASDSDHSPNNSAVTGESRESKPYYGFNYGREGDSK